MVKQAVSNKSGLFHSKNLRLCDFLEMFNIWFIPFQIPAVISHHFDVPSSLIPFLHNFDVLMESFSLFITDNQPNFTHIRHNSVARKLELTKENGYDFRIQHPKITYKQL